MSPPLRRLRERDLESLPDALADACSWIDLPTIIAEKLDVGTERKQPRVWVADGDDGSIAGIAVVSGDRLRLLVVARTERGHGIGSALLQAAEDQTAAFSERLRTGDEAGNYVAPGIDERDQETVKWFERRGYRRIAENQSLIVGLENNAKVTEVERKRAVAKCQSRGYSIKRLAPTASPAPISEIEREHGRAWALEVERAVADPSGVFVARSGGKLAAFAAYDGNNRGLASFGPAATWPAHQRKGLGAALLLCCLCDAAKRGHVEIMISWIGPRDFYDRVVGIHATRKFIVLEKSLPQSE